MSYNYDSTSRYRPHVHWNDEQIRSDEIILTTIKDVDNEYHSMLVYRFIRNLIFVFMPIVFNQKKIKQQHLFND